MLATRQNQEEAIALNLPFVELSFGVIGQALPADHGYGLYSAIVHLCPEIHEQEDVSIQTIAGEPDKAGTIHFSNNAHLRIRTPYDPNKIAIVLPLAGQTLRIGSHSIQLELPQIHPLRPVDKLRSRIVNHQKISGARTFLEAAQRQLDALGIQCNLFIPLNERGEPSRKAIKIKTYSVVGFSLVATDLSDEDSIKLQIFGCFWAARPGQPGREDWCIAL